MSISKPPLPSEPVAKSVAQPIAQPIANSPCINVCALDAAQSFCIGCFRTLDEIAAWSSANNDQRLAILAACASRRPAEKTR